MYVYLSELCSFWSLKILSTFFNKFFLIYFSTHYSKKILSKSKPTVHGKKRTAFIFLFIFFSFSWHFPLSLDKVISHRHIFVSIFFIVCLDSWTVVAFNNTYDIKQKVVNLCNSLTYLLKKINRGHLWNRIWK